MGKNDRPIRVTYESEEIALKYGSTVSKGITEMEFRLTHQSTPPPVLQNTTATFSASGTTFAVPELIAGMPAEYWKKLRKMNEEIVEAGRRGF